MSASITPFGAARETGAARHGILEALFAAITNSLLVMDSSLTIVDANRAQMERLGGTREALIGAAWTDVFPHLAAAGRERDLRAVLQSGRAHRGRMPLMSADGEVLLFDVVTYPIADPESGQVTHLVEYAHEVSEEVKLQLQIVDAHNDLLAVTEQLEDKTAEIDAANGQLEEKCAMLEECNARLEKLAVLDVMTDLPNHRAFQEWLAREVKSARRHKRAFSLILFDVDNFKQYNDRFGHPEGDVLLAQIASLTRDSIRATDLPARYGGEEFAIILPETDKYGAALVAERLRATVAEYAFPHRQVTVSVGIAEFPSDAAEGDELVTCADKAMYHAKSGGKNAVSLWGSVHDKPVLAVRGALPLLPANLMRERNGCQSVPALPASLASGSASGRSLLLIDRDDLSLGTLREALLAEGYAVRTAQTGREALGLLSDSNAAFDLIVTELVLLDKSGFDLRDEARLLCPALPFVFLTPFVSPALERQARQAGATWLLHKPFHLPVLTALLENALAPHPGAERAA